MLNKIKSLQYQIAEDGSIEEVRISFNDYTGNPNGNLNVTLTSEDGELGMLSPAQLQAIAKQKVLNELSAEPETSTPKPAEEQ